MVPYRTYVVFLRNTQPSPTRNQITKTKQNQTKSKKPESPTISLVLYVFNFIMV